ncbi:LysR family transcriptional regulator [Halotalea alkalilenta]|uniref:LysR family transcriptional regulator n=1 Tax=Halotalea alkalilenta TaxID=376489 RepID=A0A172YC81_9GAMM|nr:LysR family transcriptional regulator [Halotalea alkalilenta]ANF56828.1 LysR family transcriptional regulator [Halotalea alkalilenta]
MRDLNDLYYFVQVVEQRGFAPAGRFLGVPKSKLSRRIALLEERLGVRLIQRSSRRFTVTDIGLTYYGHCKAMLIEAEAAEDAVAMTHSEPCGTVRATCPVAMLETRVGEMVAAFMTRYPRVQLQIEATNRRVDVVGEGIDVAIRVRPPPLEDSELVMRVLSDRSQCIVASPSLLGDERTLRSPADLSGLPSLDLGPSHGEHAWRLLGPDGAEAVVNHQPRLITRSMLALRMAAVRGVGVVQLPTMMVSEELADGRLVKIMPDWAPRKEIVHAVFASRRGQLPAVRALIDFLVSGFEQLEED